MNSTPVLSPASESPTATRTALLVAPALTRLRPPPGERILQAGIVASLAFASYLLVRHYIVQTVQVVGSSMAPTLKNTDRYLLDRFSLWVRAPKASEIVVSRDPSDQGYAVKRIVAREGDTVRFVAGHLYVNERELTEAYLRPGLGAFMPIRDQKSCWVCGKNEHFVLGDNRDNSTDSRDYGIVPRQNILGLIH